MNIGCGMALMRATAAMMASAPARAGARDTGARRRPVLPPGHRRRWFGDWVETGEEVLIEGAGFRPVPRSRSRTRSTRHRSAEMVTADGTGFFETSVIPQPGEEGLWTIVASQIKGCSAETGFLVVAGPPTPSLAVPVTPAAPRPTPRPAGQWVERTDPRCPVLPCRRGLAVARGAGTSRAMTLV